MKPTTRLHYEAGRIDNRTIITVPAYGYLEGLEIRFKEPLPNMDAQKPLRFVFEPLSGAAPFEVIARCLEVE